MNNNEHEDWYDLNFNDIQDRNLELIDGLTFGNFIVCIQCDLQEITPETVMELFEEQLRRRNEDSRSLIKSNLKNIVEHAQLMN